MFGEIHSKEALGDFNPMRVDLSQAGLDPARSDPRGAKRDPRAARSGSRPTRIEARAAKSGPRASKRGQERFKNGPKAIWEASWLVLGRLWRAKS